MEVTERRKRGRTAVRLKAGPPAPPETAAAAQKTVGKRRKRADVVRETVLQAALECFGAFGYDGTSTRAVAERADVTHTLVLYHFKSKEDLWTATLDNALSVYVGAIRPALESDGDVPAGERLRRFIEQFVRFSAQYPQIHRIMTMEGNQDTARLEWVINNYLRDHFEQIRNLIRKAQDEGSVRDCDAARLYYFIIGGAGTLFTLSTEYLALTGRDVFSETEILRNLAFLYEIVFVSER